LLFEFFLPLELTLFRLLLTALGIFGLLLAQQFLFQFFGFLSLLLLQGLSFLPLLHLRYLLLPFYLSLHLSAFRFFTLLVFALFLLCCFELGFLDDGLLYFLHV